MARRNQLIDGIRSSDFLTPVEIERAQTLQSQWEAEGGLVIGPFAFGAAGGGNSEQDTFSSDGATVTLTNKASWPYIVAFVSNLVAQPQQAAAASANPQALYHPRRLIRRA